jgi:molecular chaperone DnaK
MSENDGNGSEKRRHARTPLNVLVQFRFDTFEEFLAEYSLNISPGGIFIRTELPRDEGAIIYLQFSLRDGSKLIEGMGRVVRVNPPPGTTERPPGMGIEFVNFDAASMTLISEICAQRSHFKTKEP